MLIESAAELLGEAERLQLEGDGAEEPAASAATANGGAAAAANGSAQAEGMGEQQQGAEGEEEAEADMTPVQTAQHYAMRNLMNAAGVLDGLQQYERGEALLAKALDIAVVGWGAGSMQHLNVLYALAQHFRWVGCVDALLPCCEPCGRMCCPCRCQRQSFL